MPFDLSTAKEITPPEPASPNPAAPKFDMSTAKEIPMERQHTYRESTRMTVEAPYGLRPEQIEFLDDTQNQAKPRSRFFGYTDLGDAALDPLRGLGGFIASTPQIAATAGIEYGERVAEANAEMSKKEPVPMFDWVKSTGEWLAENVGVFKPETAPKILEASKKLQASNEEFIAKHGLEPKGLLGDIGAGAGSVGAAVAMTMITRNPVWASAYFGELQKTQTYREARDAGLSATEAGKVSTVAGVNEGAIEAIGGKIFLDIGKQSKPIRRILSRTIEESVQEAAQQTAESVVLNQADVRDQSTKEILGDIAYSAMIGAIVSAPVSTVVEFTGRKAEEAGLSRALGENIGTRVWSRRAELEEQDIYTWARHDTNGFFVGTCSVTEPPVDALYVIVKRYVGGQWKYYSERMDNGTGRRRKTASALIPVCSIR